jgi:hypothetical protein
VNVGLGQRRLIGWVALFAAGLVVGGYLAGTEWVRLVLGMLTFGRVA